MTAQPIQSLDDDVAAYLDLTERIEQLEARRTTIRARLAQRGEGTHTTTAGIAVTVTPPNRRFNLDRAWTLLTPEQQALCTSPDPKKVKAQLPGVLVDELMEPGTGAFKVTVK
ncbi:MAG: hypothetical protein HOQ43_14205 [Glycomyces artemisiae]|uniref:Uncharacterized protein n=1 Tax=Glycomyces artemisiae TaxID=1076443 RepID=A0A850CCB4_9ACTN|nr:hypothetical protein [Glycomyces artemisiae]